MLFEEEEEEEEIDMACVGSSDEKNFVARDAKLRSTLGHEQARVFDAVITQWASGQQVLIFVHGGPDTGKTHLSKAIREAAAYRNKKGQFCAIHGVGATMQEGVT